MLRGRANAVVHTVRSARVLFRSNSTVDRDREPVSLEAIKKSDLVVGDCECESLSPSEKNKTNGCLFHGGFVFRCIRR